MTDHKAAFGTLTADLKAKKDPEDPNGEFEAVLSMPTLDRDGEIIDEGAFLPLPDHVTIDIDHGMSTDTTVGSGEPFYDGDTLMFRGTFSSLPRAQEVRTLVTEGHVRKMSVAFMNAQRVDDDDGVTHITRAELLNAAIVPIPSNREASILAAKAAKAHAEELAEEADMPTIPRQNGKGVDEQAAYAAWRDAVAANNLTTTAFGRSLLADAGVAARATIATAEDNEKAAADEAPARSSLPALAKARAQLASAEVLAP